MTNDRDFIKKIKDLEKAIKELQSGRLIVNLTIPDDGSFRAPTGASDPVSAVEGQLFVNTTTHKLKVYVSGAWVAVH